MPSKELGGDGKLGEVVGYRVKYEDTIYCTRQMEMEAMQCSSTASFPGTDELCWTRLMREQSTDILVSVVKAAVRSRSYDPPEGNHDVNNSGC